MYIATVTHYAAPLHLQEFELETLLAGHDGYVNSLEFIPADDDCKCKPVALACLSGDHS